MFGTIILQDIPKQAVHLDLWSYKLQSGFWGFQMVPTGVHYLNALADATHSGFWLGLPPNKVVVKVFDSTQNQFVDDEPQSAEQYRQLAASGAMDKVLIPYPHAE